MSSLPESLSRLPWELPRNFLGLEEGADWDAADVVILPVPYEATVSYQSGTKWGPRGILEASRYIELYDQELDAEPAEIGVTTLPALSLTSAGPEAAVRELREAYEAILQEAKDKLVIALGGEHSITSAPVIAHAERISRQGGRLSVLQFDAHSDLRLEYEGSPYSHASVMARCMNDADIVAVGIRALTGEERQLIRERDGITTIFAEEMWDNEEWIDRALDALGPEVYITFDVDYFDPSLVPATGTPEPGGIGWYPTMKLLRRAFTEKRVVGVDVVEFAPLGGNAAPDFAIAKLVYKMVGYRWLSRQRGSGRAG